MAHVFLRGSQVGQACSLAGLLLGTGLALLRLDLPMLAGGGLMVALATALAPLVPERHFSPTYRKEHATWQVLSGTLRQSVRLVRHSPLLPTILIVALFSGMSTEGFDRLNVAHFLDDFTVPSLGPLAPVAWFGGMKVIATLLGLVAIELARRWITHESPKALARALVVLNVLLVACILAFGLVRGFTLALITFLCVSVLRITISPLYTAWLTRSSPAEVRATVVSMSGQMDALGQIAAGPVVGVIGLLRSLRVALVVTGLLLSPSLPLYSRALRKDSLLKSENLVGVEDETVSS
jgi:DHA3 family tetracycline resistance protein-like MFS transporter